jgi:hypothetical protein
MRKILKQLLIIQEVPNRGSREPLLGKGYTYARRLNPYHPLSYVVVIVALIAALVCFGIIGMWREIDKQNPFKWS